MNTCTPRLRLQLVFRETHGKPFAKPRNSRKEGLPLSYLFIWHFRHHAKDFEAQRGPWVSNHSCAEILLQQTQVPQQSSISAALADAITPSSPGTPNRKRNMEDRKTDSNRGVLPAPVESGEVKKLTAEIDEQKRVIAELTAQKDTLEHVCSL